MMQGRTLPLLAAAFVGQHARVTALIGPNQTKLRRFFEYVRTLYIDVPYHNPMHAAQVVWAVHALLHATGAWHVLPPLYVLALYVAAACHDVGHKCASPLSASATRHQTAFDAAAVPQQSHQSLPGACAHCSVAGEVNVWCSFPGILLHRSHLLWVPYIEKFA